MEALFGNDSDARRQALIQSLMRPQQSSNSSLNVGALFSPLAGALMQKKLDSQMAQQDARGNRVLANALRTAQGSPQGLDATTGISWDTARPGNPTEGIAQLLQTPETARIGQQMAIAGLQKEMGTGAAQPSSIREWEYYNSLSDADKLAYREMKRATLDKGMTLNPDGTVSNMGGYNRALTEQSYADESGTQRAKNENEPWREGAKQQATADVDLVMKPQTAEATAEATVKGKERGEAGAKLESMEAQLPRLETVVEKLGALGDKATYTKAGQARDIGVRELGMDPTEGAIARTEYMATVDNEVLPLLRQTFGAQFTVQEGESLRKTLGDPNKTPQEKRAVLRAFIDQKRGEIESLKRQTGQEAPAAVDYREFFK